MRLIVQEDYKKLSKWVAHYIARSINEFEPTPEKQFILGLPTGSSPVGTYQELVKLVKSKRPGALPHRDLKSAIMIARRMSYRMRR